MSKCLIIDAAHPSLVPLLEKSGLTPDYRPEIKADEVHRIIGQYEGLIVRSKMQVDRALLQKAVNLRFIARSGAGTDQIDEAALKEKGIALFNAPEGNRDAVGEHAVGMLLCLMNHLHLADRQVRQKIWLREENRGWEIGGKTVSIIGYGNMGRAFAKRLSGFGCEVITYDKYVKGCGDAYARAVEIEEIFNETDILSFHIPLNEENRGLAGDGYFDSFKKSIYLINTARGEVVPMKSVRQGLENGKILGAALDVLENEKLHTLTPEQERDFSFLAASDKVLFSPHVAGWTFESYEKINIALVRKIAAFLGKP